jgi:hypothetical protein
VRGCGGSAGVLGAVLARVKLAKPADDGGQRDGRHGGVAAMPSPARDCSPPPVPPSC